MLHLSVSVVLELLPTNYRKGAILIKKSIIICTVVLCVVLLCSTALAASYPFDFQLRSGTIIGIGLVTTDRSSTQTKADGEGRAYVRPTSRRFIDTRDELELYVVPKGGTTAATKKLSVTSSSPSMNVSKKLAYTGEYTVRGSYELFCNAIALWKDASVGGRWTP